MLNHSIFNSLGKKLITEYTSQMYMFFAGQVNDRFGAK